MSEHKPNARPRGSQPPVGRGERIALVIGAIVVGSLAFLTWIALLSTAY